MWAAVLPMMLASSAALALGTVAGITGDSTAVVLEPLAVDPSPGGSKLVLSTGASTDLVVFNDDTSFAGTARTFPGDSYAIKMLLVNASNADVIQRLMFESPDGFRLAASGGSRVSLSQESAKTFLVRVDKDASAGGTLTNDNDDNPAMDELRIKIEVDDQVLPGFYTVKMLTDQLVSRKLGEAR